MRTIERIDYFRDRWAFLSNFFPARMLWQGVFYPTSEHAFNAGKTTDLGLRFKIASAHSPKIAKRMGRAVKIRPGWENPVRYQVMWDVLHAKFTSHPGRVAALLGTGDAFLVEGNRWHDQHWGNCICGQPACAEPGQNHLGRMLMDLREELRQA